MANPWDNDPVVSGNSPASTPWLNDPVVSKSKLDLSANSDPSINASISQIPQSIGNLFAGAIRGAGSIGATLLAPYDIAKDALAGKGLSLDSNNQRRADIDAGLQSLGAQPDSNLYKAGKVGAEIAGTAGVGGGIANTVSKVAPVVADAAPSLINAIRTSGMTAGELPAGASALSAPAIQNMATRTVGGAISGGTQAALVDPTDAAKGAAFGAVLPPTIKVLGATGAGAANAWRNMIASGDRAGAQALEKALMIGSPEERQDIITKLQSAPTLVPGSTPTVAQALQTPQASILNRVVYDSPGGAQLQNTLANQDTARLTALENVAPTGATGYADAKNDMGNAIVSRVIPEEKAISGQVSQMYNKIDPNSTESIPVPVDQMQAAVDKYLGKGSFGDNNAPIAAMSAAKSLGTATPANSLMNAPAKPPSASWNQALNIRSSLNDAISKATIAGDKQAVAALTSQKSALDQSIQQNLSPDALSAFNEANASHAAKMDRFYGGPQASIFQTGSNGQPAVQGGEVAGKFWNQSPGAAQDVQNFRKLIDDNPDLLGRFKSLVTTQGAGTSDAAGNLGANFSKWVDQSLPGLRETFTPAETQQLQNIAADIDRNSAANKAGTSLGGSNSYQNASNALNLGFLDNPIVNKAANMIPGAKYVTGPALSGITNSLRNTKAKQLAGLLSDSGAAANALEKYGGSQSTPDTEQVATLKKLLSQAAAKSLPVAASQ